MYRFYNHNVFIILTVIAGGVNGILPGTYFWKPRLTLDFPEKNATESGPQIISGRDIRDGYVVLINAYHLGLSILVFADIPTYLEPYRHLNPGKPDFYTNAYRWTLRHLKLLPVWINGAAGPYPMTHKAWLLRFENKDAFLPKIFRYLLPFIKDSEWQREYDDWKRFKKYAQPIFSQYFRFPSKVFTNYKSMEVSDPNFFERTLSSSS